jgi:hypothetical protein
MSYTGGEMVAIAGLSEMSMRQIKLTDARTSFVGDGDLPPRNGRPIPWRGLD